MSEHVSSKARITWDAVDRVAWEMEWLPSRREPRFTVRRNFAAAELQCRCGHCVGFMNARALDLLQHTRTEWGRPLTVTSAYRCPEHNRAVGGAARSMHMLGAAFDLSWEGWAPEARNAFLGLAGDLGWHGIGQYPGWVHLDLGLSRSWGAQR